MAPAVGKCTVTGCCGKLFQGEKGLKTHMNHVKKNKRFCLPCHRMFGTDAEMKKHRKTCKGTAYSETCKHCKKTFTDRATGEKHMADGACLSIACPYTGCDKKFSNDYDLLSHAADCNCWPGKSCPFPRCSDQPAKRGTLRAHMRVCDRRCGFPCPNCPLARYPAQEHKCPVPEEKEEKEAVMLTCPNCAVQFPKGTEHTCDMDLIAALGDDSPGATGKNSGPTKGDTGDTNKGAQPGLTDFQDMVKKAFSTGQNIIAIDSQISAANTHQEVIAKSIGDPGRTKMMPEVLMWYENQGRSTGAVMPQVNKALTSYVEEVLPNSSRTALYGWLDKGGHDQEPGHMYYDLSTKLLRVVVEAECEVYDSLDPLSRAMELSPLTQQRCLHLGKLSRNTGGGSTRSGGEGGGKGGGRGKQPRQQDERICFNCNKAGHIRRDCRLPDRRQPKDGLRRKKGVKKNPTAPAPAAAEADP